MVADGLAHESSPQYAYSLKELFEKYSEYRIHELAKSLHNDLLSKIKFFEIISEYGLSLSWVYWDIAKQYYFYKNPHLQKSPILYPPKNPMEDKNIQEEIVLRQLGWEIFRQRENEELLKKISNEKIVMDYIKKTPKEGGQLRSWDYKNFGGFLSTVEISFKINRKVVTNGFTEVAEWIPVQFKK
ncbi:hypothetical protein VB796_21630 [Arcicella sp. LKC2W]|uniref:hypothetical protein n=1 Tax=Arcicella sp. LKC2W TaxID=2984198 RepID=UPI002B21CA72|nr:hypothetical protein [Arcicella sp. LKC2W]MEA5461684.1 hypothetical protein [Arcicella sp. LKC2W]